MAKPAAKKKPAAKAKVPASKAPKAAVGQGGIKDLALGRSDVYHVDPRALQVKPGWNCRDKDFDPNDADDLAFASSVAQGVKEALTVVWENGKPFVTNGHRRRAAALYAIENLGAEIRSVPVRTEDRYSSEADHVFSQIVRNSGKPLKPLEQARVLKKLIDLGWNETDIALKSGLHRAWVVQLLDLQAAPAAITNMVKEGAVSATLAIETLKRTKGDDAKAANDLGKAVEKAQGEGKTRATAQHLPEKPLPLKARLKAIFEAVKFEDVGVYYTAEFTPEQYSEIRVALGL